MLKTKWLIACVAAALVAVSVATVALGKVSPTLPTMRIGSHTIRLLTAKTEAQITRGLSGHAILPDDMGMLFYFDHPDIYPFWMPEMRFPLDIIWIKQDVVQEVARLEVPVPGRPIPAHTPTHTADRVLEIDAGLAARYGLAPGVKVQLPN